MTPCTRSSPSKTKKNDNEDPIIQEFPLVFEKSENHLNLLYFPLSVPDAANTIPSFDQDSSTLHVKPECRQLQITYGRRKFWGTAQHKLRTQEHVAVVREGKIYLQTIEAFYTMRPQVATSSSSSATSSNDSKGDEAVGEAKPVTIIKKRETEEQALARLSSYVYLRKKAEEEPWKVMRLVKK